MPRDEAADGPDGNKASEGLGEVDGDRDPQGLGGLGMGSGLGTPADECRTLVTHEVRAGSVDLPSPPRRAFAPACRQPHRCSRRTLKGHSHDCTTCSPASGGRCANYNGDDAQYGRWAVARASDDASGPSHGYGETGRRPYTREGKVELFSRPSPPCCTCHRRLAPPTPPSASVPTAGRGRRGRRAEPPREGGGAAE